MDNEDVIAITNLILNGCSVDSFDVLDVVRRDLLAKTLAKYTQRHVLLLPYLETWIDAINSSFKRVQMSNYSIHVTCCHFVYEISSVVGQKVVSRLLNHAVYDIDFFITQTLIFMHDKSKWVILYTLLLHVNMLVLNPINFNKKFIANEDLTAVLNEETKYQLGVFLDSVTQFYPTVTYFGLLLGLGFRLANYANAIHIQAAELISRVITHATLPNSDNYVPIISSYYTALFTSINRMDINNKSTLQCFLLVSHLLITKMKTQELQSIHLIATYITINLLKQHDCAAQNEHVAVYEIKINQGLASKFSLIKLTDKIKELAHKVLRNNNFPVITQFFDEIMGAPETMIRQHLNITVTYLNANLSSKVLTIRNKAAKNLVKLIFQTCASQKQQSKITQGIIKNLNDQISNFFTHNISNVDLADHMSRMAYLYEFSDAHAWHGNLLFISYILKTANRCPLHLYIDSIFSIVTASLFFTKDVGTLRVGSQIKDTAVYITWLLAHFYLDKKHIALVRLSKEGTKEEKFTRTTKQCEYSTLLVEDKLYLYFKTFLSNALLCLALFDPEIMVRKAAISTFQEYAGRLGTDCFDQGIAVLELLNYYSCGNTTKSYTLLAAKIAIILPKATCAMMINYLLAYPLIQRTTTSRILAAIALSQLFTINNSISSWLSPLVINNNLAGNINDPFTHHGFLSLLYQLLRSQRNISSNVSAITDSSYLLSASSSHSNEVLIHTDSGSWISEYLCMLNNLTEVKKTNQQHFKCTSQKTKRQNIASDIWSIIEKCVSHSIYNEPLVSKLFGDESSIDLKTFLELSLEEHVSYLYQSNETGLIMLKILKIFLSNELPNFYFNISNKICFRRLIGYLFILTVHADIIIQKKAIKLICLLFSEPIVNFMKTKTGKNFLTLFEYEQVKKYYSDLRLKPRMSGVEYQKYSKCELLLNLMYFKKNHTYGISLMHGIILGLPSHMEFTFELKKMHLSCIEAYLYQLERISRPLDGNMTIIISALNMLSNDQSSDHRGDLGCIIRTRVLDIACKYFFLILSNDQDCNLNGVFPELIKFMTLDRIDSIRTKASDFLMGKIELIPPNSYNLGRSTFGIAFKLMLQHKQNNSSQDTMQKYIVRIVLYHGHLCANKKTDENSTEFNAILSSLEAQGIEIMAQLFKVYLELLEINEDKEREKCLYSVVISLLSAISYFKQDNNMASNVIELNDIFVQIIGKLTDIITKQRPPMLIKLVLNTIEELSRNGDADVVTYYLKSACMVLAHKYPWVRKMMAELMLQAIEFDFKPFQIQYKIAVVPLIHEFNWATATQNEAKLQRDKIKQLSLEVYNY